MTAVPTSRARASSAKQLRFAAAVLAASAGWIALTAPPAVARVTWTAWQDSSFEAVVDAAARSGRLLMLVVTQPDWCPPCIRLNARFLENEAATIVADLTRDLVVVEVWGYDEPGATILRRHLVRFPGTPTTFVFRPERPGVPLGEAPLLGGIVGAPDDFAEQLARLVAGHDPVAEAAAKVEAAETPRERAEALLDLAARHVERGDVEAVLAALEAVHLAANEDAELADLARQADWLRVTRVELRLRKDPEAGLAALADFERRHAPEGEEADELAYHRAFALADLGRVPDARRLFEERFLADGTAAGRDAFLYAAFRLGEPSLLARAEEVGLAALAQDPESPFNVLQGLGRVHRRQGRPREAVRRFDEALAAAATDGQREFAQGQLEHARRELAAQGTPFRPQGAVSPGGWTRGRFLILAVVVPTIVVGGALLLGRRQARGSGA